MQMIADLHTHTLCATHAYNTFTEMAAAAKALGYCALAVTDHAPAMPDAPHAWHFGNWSAMPRTIDGVAILYGAEANVMDTKGGLDLSQSQLKAQDWVVASIHSACVPGLLTRREANRLWLAVAENPYVDCIGHSEQENYRYDYDLVTRASTATHSMSARTASPICGRCWLHALPTAAALLWTAMPTAHTSCSTACVPCMPCWRKCSSRRS